MIQRDLLCNVHRPAPRSGKAVSQDLGILYSGHLLERHHQYLPLWLTFSLASAKPTPLLSNWHILFFFFWNTLTPLNTAYTHLGSNVSFQNHLPYFSSNPCVSPSYNYSLKEVQMLGCSRRLYPPPTPRYTCLKCNWKLKPLQKLSKWANICLNYSIYNSKNISSVEVCVQEVAPKPFLREFWHQWNVMLAGWVKCLINKESQCFQTHIPSSLIWRKPQTENALLLTVTRGLCLSFPLTQSAYFGAWVGKKHGQ